MYIGGEQRKKIGTGVVRRWRKEAGKTQKRKRGSKNASVA